MKSSRGVYSIIQFCPDIGRGEGINVGIAVVCDELKKRKILFSQNNELVKKRLRKAGFDGPRLTSSKRAMQVRLSKIEPSETSLREFIGRQSGYLIFQPIRSIAIDDFDVDVMWLFDKLVGEIEPEKRISARPNLKNYFEPLIQENVPLVVNQEITVPVSNSKMDVPYAYHNGKLNYIVSKGFSADRKDVVEQASILATQGNFIQKYPGEKEKQLIVVTGFRNKEYKNSVSKIFQEYKIDMFEEDDMSDLIDRVKREAH